MNNNPKFKQVECGDYHTGFLTESGVLYVTGDNSTGQLGLEKMPLNQNEKLQSSDRTNMTTYPLAVDFNNQLKIRKLAFGSQFSSLLTFSGEVYLWGNGDLKVPTVLKADHTN